MLDRGLAEVQNLRDVQTAANLDRTLSLRYCLNSVSFRQPRCSVPISHSVMIVFFIPFAQKLTLCCYLLLYTLDLSLQELVCPCWILLFISSICTSLSWWCHSFAFARFRVHAF